MRDLFVFLVLFLLGLAVWTTGLFPPVTVQAVPPVQSEIEKREAAIVRSPELESPASEIQAPSQVDTLTTPEPEPVLEEASSTESLSRSSTEKESKSVTRDQNLNEPAIRRIIIPSLKVDAQVVDIPFNGVTWDISSLGQDVARLGEVPGENSGENIVLAGHFSTSLVDLGPFRYISRLAFGEPVLVFTDRVVYTYQVREHAVVGDQDERVIAYTSEPQLTLLTCETWDEETKRFLRRRVVFADLVRSEPIGHQNIQ